MGAVVIAFAVTAIAVMAIVVHEVLVVATASTFTGPTPVAALTETEITTATFVAPQSVFKAASTSIMTQTAEKMSCCGIMVATASPLVVTAPITPR